MRKTSHRFLLNQLLLSRFLFFSLKMRHYFKVYHIALLMAILLFAGSLASAMPQKIVVAVIDTGVDINHESLKGNIWKNQGESGKDESGNDKATNGKDDDGNGFIDDVHGWNFVQGSSQIDDRHGHGTHIAGIVAQNKDVELMILKGLDAEQTGEAAIDATVSAISYAIKMKADIINYSGGGSVSHPRERTILELAQRKGILVVAAAGNFRVNTDENGFYPASYNLKNIISVAAVDHNGQLLQSSNYGKNTILLAADGKEVLSALPQNKWGKMTGTSQATAKVTRALASLLMKSAKPIDELIKTGKRSSSLIDKTKKAVIIGNE